MRQTKHQFYEGVLQLVYCNRAHGSLASTWHHDKRVQRTTARCERKKVGIRPSGCGDACDLLMYGRRRWPREPPYSKTFKVQDCEV